MRRSGWIIIAITALLLALGGCAEKKGKTGDTGPAGPPGAAGGVFATAIESCAGCHGAGGAISVASGAGVHGTSLPASNLPTDLNTEIVSVDVSSANEIAVTVKVTNAVGGAAVTNLSAGDIRFTIAKFIVAASAVNGVGEWQNYFTGQTSATNPLNTQYASYQSTDTAATSGAKATGGVYDSSASATGVYKWTFGDGVSTTKKFTADVAGPTLRIGTQVSVSAKAAYPYGARTVTNGWSDFVIATGNTGFPCLNAAQGGAACGTDTLTVAAKGPLNPSGAPTNHLVDTANCDECHTALAVHGGGRRTVEFCVTCHNSGNGVYTNSDAEGDSIDFKQFLHKLHRGQELPSVAAGGTYGIGNSDFSKGTFPQTLTNCDKCHADATGKNYNSGGGTIAGTLTNGNWKAEPSTQACASCHDLTSFADTVPTGFAPHTGGQTTALGGTTPAVCKTCHVNPTNSYDVKKIENAHSWGLQVAAAANYVYKINSASYQTDSTKADYQKLTVKFQIEKPAGTKTDITAAAQWKVTGSTASGLRVQFGWKAPGTKDYANDGASDGKTPGIPLQWNLLGTFPTSAGATLTDDGTHVYTLVTEAIPAAATAGAGIVFIDGHPVEALPASGKNRTIPVISSEKEFRILDSSSAFANRRAVVDESKCQDCHNSLSLHGENRTASTTYGVTVCTTCHNSANTDINRRPTDVAQTDDGLKEQAIDFKYMIHRIHKGRDASAGFFEVFGFGGSKNKFQGEFPPGRDLSDCQNCHYAANDALPAYAVSFAGGVFVDDTNVLPLVSGLQGTTNDSGTDRVSHSDDLNVTPNSAVCSSCHDDSAAKDHMVRNGGNFSVLESNIEFY